MSHSLTDHLKLDPNSGVPLIAQLAEQITWLIASGELKAGDKLPPMRELADGLGIHMHTVRQVYQRLEAARLVSVRTRRGTEVLPYDSAALAERSPDTATHLLGVILPNPVSFYSPFIKSIQEAARDLRYLPLFCYCFDNPYLVETYFNQLIARQMDGFIITSLSLPALVENPVLLEQYPPLVSVDAPDMPGYQVLLDSEGAAFQVTSHLVGHGYRRIGLITPPLEWPNVLPFYQGFERSLDEAGLGLDPDLVQIVPGFERHSGRAGAERLLDRDQRPEALVAAADLLALGAREAIRQRGLTIPDDIALVGYNDIEAASLVYPGLTTASIPAVEMGAQAMEMLMALLAGKKPAPKTRIIPSKLVIRQSCGCPADSI